MAAGISDFHFSTNAFDVMSRRFHNSIRPETAEMSFRFAVNVTGCVVPADAAPEAIAVVCVSRAMTNDTPSDTRRRKLSIDPGAQKSLRASAPTQYGKMSCLTSAEGTPARLPRIVTTCPLTACVMAPYSAATERTFAAGPCETTLVVPDDAPAVPDCSSVREPSNFFTKSLKAKRFARSALATKIA